MEKIVEETVNKFGRIDILVNNAGWAFEVIPIFDHTIENYDKTMEMNVRTVVVLTKLCLPFLRKSKGIIESFSYKTHKYFNNILGFSRQSDQL